MNETKAGVITHFFPNISVGIIKADVQIKVGNTVHIKGSVTDFEQTLDEMQYEHQNVDLVEPGQEVGVKVKDKVREGDEVFLVA